MTQEEFDDKVIAIASQHVTRMGVAADLRRQGDSHAKRIEQEQMMVQNVLSALQDYDITAEILTDDEIEYMYELASGALKYSFSVLPIGSPLE